MCNAIHCWEFADFGPWPPCHISLKKGTMHWFFWKQISQMMVNTTRYDLVPNVSYIWARYLHTHTIHSNLQNFLAECMLELSSIQGFASGTSIWHDGTPELVWNYTTHGKVNTLEVLLCDTDTDDILFSLHYTMLNDCTKRPMGHNCYWWRLTNLRVVLQYTLRREGTPRYPKG